MNTSIPKESFTHSRLRLVCASWILPLLLLALPAVVQAQFIYTINNGTTITITGYIGPGGAVTIPSSINGLPVTSILGFPGGGGPGAFGDCPGLTSVTIPDSVTSIGYAAFAFSGLTSVTIGNGVTSIGSQAFLACTSLTSVTIPDSVTSIEGGAFAECFSLIVITVGASNSVYSSVDGVLFDQSQTTLIQCPAGKAGSYTIPNSVTSIGGGAFAYSGLTSVTIGNGVTSIGGGAFAACGSLTSVYFMGNAPSADTTVFQYDSNVTVYYLPGTTGWGPTFAGCLTTLWQPLIQTPNGGIGMQTNQFGFNIAWAANQVIVVEACTNLASPVWFPLQTNTLIGGSFYFSDSSWSNYPARFYRVRSP